MRIENVGTPKSIPETQPHPGLSEGDVLIAEVKALSGDKVFLKNQDGGAVLTAKLLTDIGVAAGDFVETVVDEANGGQYVLRVIDVSRQMPFGTNEGFDTAATLNQTARAQMLLNTLTILKNNPGADPKAAEFLSKHGIAGSAENIETLAQMTKGTSSVTDLLARVIETFSAAEKASLPQAAPLADAAVLSQNTAILEGKVQNAAAGLPELSDQGAGQTAPASQGLPLVENSGQLHTLPQTPPSNAESAGQTLQMPIGNGQSIGQAPPQTPVANGQSAGQAPLQTPAADGQNMAQPAPMANGQQPSQTLEPVGLPVSNEAASQNVLPQTGIGQEPESVMNPPAAQPAGQPGQTETAEVGCQTSEGNSTSVTSQTSAAAASESGKLDMNKPVKNEQAAPLGSQEPQNTASKQAVHHERIVSKAQSMFADMDDAQQLVVHIKKAVRTMPEQLKELKLLIHDTDNTVKEAVKFDQVEKQMSLMSGVKQFDCYQIPLQNGPQQQTTAELFVYKYRGGKKDVDPENILILLGLDTQYMGRVEALVKTSGKNLTIEFNLEDMRLSGDMEADAEQLSVAVKQAGYHLAGVSVKQLAARTTVINAEQRFEKETDGNAGNLDIRI